MMSAVMQMIACCFLFVAMYGQPMMVNCQLTAPRGELTRNRNEPGDAATSGELAEQMETEFDSLNAKLDRMQDTLQLTLNNMSSSLSDAIQQKKECKPNERGDSGVAVTMRSLTVAHSLTFDRVIDGIHSVALLRDELFATHAFEGRVTVYNATSLQLKRRIVVVSPSGRGIVDGLAVCPFNNYLYVSVDILTAGSADRVFRVDLNDESKPIIGWNVTNARAGLSVNSEHNVLMADLNKVKIFTPTGTLIRQISSTRFLFQAIETRSGTLMVSRFYDVDGIVELAGGGQELRRYGNVPGAGEGRLNGPHSIALDSNGYVIVADTNNNRIQVVNPSLTAARTLPLPVDVDLSGPRGLWYDESRGRLYVTESTGQYRLLVFDHVPNLNTLFD